MNDLIMDWVMTNTANILHITKTYIAGKIVHIPLDGGWAVFHDTTRELEDDFTVNPVGQKVYFSGWLQQTNASDVSICTLPYEFRPMTTKEVICMTDRGMDTITIRKNGDVIYNNSSGGTLLNLSSTFYDKR